jgi:hypothetical protein
MNGSKHSIENNYYFVRNTSAYLGYKARTELFDNPEKAERGLYRMIWFKKNTIEFPNGWSSKKIKLTEYKNGIELKFKVKK